MPDKPPPRAAHVDIAENGLTASNIKKIPAQQTAVAISSGHASGEGVQVTAAGRGKIAEQILQLAFENGIKVREDPALAEMLAKVELDSPIPSEAFMAVAEVLSYVYKANGEPHPFDAVLDATALAAEPPPKDS
ncbi:MAG: EscU/YscU/HrcU family type III secretion system export apparatus switch protein [Pseudobdellovibrionaceae bacterium]